MGMCVSMPSFPDSLIFLDLHYFQDKAFLLQRVRKHFRVSMWVLRLGMTESGPTETPPQGCAWDRKHPAGLLWTFGVQLTSAEETNSWGKDGPKAYNCVPVPRQEIPKASIIGNKGCIECTEFTEGKRQVQMRPFICEEGSCSQSRGP